MNRYTKQFQSAFEQDTVTLYASAVIGASGAVGTVKGGGIKSVTLGTTGEYTVLLQDRYSRILSIKADIFGATASGISKIQLIAAPATFQADFKATPEFDLQCYDYTETAANPPAGSVMSLVIVVRRSSVGPWDN